ncbi:MAG: glutaminase A, partial [Planctomycetota bacterium]
MAPSSPSAHAQQGNPDAEIEAALEAAYREHLPLLDGELASSIPELACVEPNRFGVAVCDVDGVVHAVGDTDTRFTIQSISKVLLYALALEEIGAAQLGELVGVEPSGKLFDSMIRPEHGTRRPQNAMVNAGAIVVASLLHQQHGDGSFSRFLDFAIACAGDRPLQVDEAVFRSEMAHGSKNRAIAFQMRHNEMLLGAVEPALEDYFRACSISVDCGELAQIAATLANGGVQPTTGERLFPQTVATQALSVMSTCGMYEASGAWAVSVGLPAKSGISGGIIAVAPGRRGLAAFSPRIDSSGNSVRGQRAITQVVRELDLHGFAPRTGRAPEDIDALETAVEDTYRELLERRGESAAAPPLTIAICTVDGEERVVGDVDWTFPLQAAGNPFTYALALSDHGAEVTHQKVGVEPSGNPFSAVYLDPRTGRPFNPLGNTGAIAIASLFPSANSAERRQLLSERLGAFAGEDPLESDFATLTHEREHGDHNRSIAHFLRSHGVIEEVNATLELYFHQCSLLVSARTLARMAATLAAGGDPRCPGPGVIDPIDARRVIAQMYICGMHDSSGHFAFEVGIPAKSGISGGIVGAVPGRVGI